jgi:hypothetical protein
VLAAFGRLFFFGTLTPSGESNVLGISWNGAGDETDWTGLDAGSELLLSDTSQSDRIVAGRILSYDTVGILCRRSLWIGVRTGVANRPMDPQLRLSGIGCVFEGSARTTEGGITFLSDEGVRHFNGQTAEIISGSINQELLPLNFDEISSYKATWDGGRRRYILCAPCCTFIYQFPTPEYPQGAWFKRIIGLTNVVTFADQTDDPTWNDLGDQTWPGFNDLLWLELATPESNEPPRVLWVSGMQYGVDDPDGDGYFGLIISGLAVPRPIEGQAADDQTHRLMEVKGYLIEHRGSGDVQIIARDELGGYRIVAELSLPLALKTKTTRLDLQHSIRGVGIALRLLSSDLEILSVKQIVQDSGPALGDMVTEDDELFDETSEDVYLEADTLVLWR